MTIPRIAIIVFGIVMISAFENGALATLIPIFGILAGIIAIVAFSPIGKAIANNISGQTGLNANGVSVGEFNNLREKCQRLEDKLNTYEDEMNKMREAIIFSDTKKISVSAGSSEENKSIINKQINLEKTL